MEAHNDKTTVWVPREAFDAVHRLWKPEFNWIPVPVDRSLPPGQIAYLDAAGPISPLPPPPSRLVPPTPSVNTPRTPLGLPSLETVLLERRSSGYFHGTSPEELETAITRGTFSPASNEEDEPSTPSTATEPESPATPKDSSNLSQPAILEQETQQPEAANRRSAESKPVIVTHRDGSAPHSNGASRVPPSRNEQGEAVSTIPWKLIDQRPNYGPKHGRMKPASWKTLDGSRNLRMQDRWQALRRDETHWDGSPKGFAVRVEMNLNVELELKGSINGDITLSAEALYVSFFFAQCVLSVWSLAEKLTTNIPRHYDVGECPLMAYV